MYWTVFFMPKDPERKKSRKSEVEEKDHIPESLAEDMEMADGTVSAQHP